MFNVRKVLKKIFFASTVVIIVISVLLTVVSFTPEFRSSAADYVAHTGSLLPIIVLVLKVIAIAFPPISGGWLSYLSIVYIGWVDAAILDSVGSLLGGIIGFFLARRYRERLVAKVVPLKNLGILEQKLNHRQKFWAFLSIRLSTGPIYDYLNYLVALTNLKFTTYLIVSVIAIIPNFMFFYLASLGFELSPLYFIIFLIPLAVLYFVYKQSWKNFEEPSSI